MKGKTILTLGCGLVIALLLVACGGGDADTTGAGSTASGEPLSKKGYIEQGDQICAQGTLEIAKRAQERFGTTQPASTEEVEAFAKEDVAVVLQGQADDLRALPPPKGDEQEVHAIYDAVQDGIDKLEADPSLLIQNDVGGAFDEADHRAQDYGFQQCGSE